MTNPVVSAVAPALSTEAYSGADYTLDALTRARLVEAVPANTRRAYEWAWGLFTGWCEKHGRVPLVATAQTLADYVSDRITLGWAPASIEQAIGIVRSAHAKSGRKGHPDTEPALLLLRGYKRERAEAGIGQTQAVPFTPDSLRQTIDALDLSTPAGRRDRVLLVFGFQMMARRSELARLWFTDITETAKGLEVLVRTSKTDHHSQGRVTPLPPQDDPRVDPVRILAEWRTEFDDGPLLRRTNRNGELTGPLSTAGINLVVKRAATRAGLADPQRYSAHSLRAGGLTAALMAGQPVSIAARHGGWDPESPTVLRYARAADRWRDNAMRGVFG